MTSLLQRIRQRDAAQRRDDGMARAASHAGDTWAAAANRMIVAYLYHHEFFHVDEFWDWAIPRGLPEGESPRAIGPVIKSVARQGSMTKTLVSLSSVRSNLSAKPVWRSELFAGARNLTFRGVPIP
jgi:hypothetical protein